MENFYKKGCIKRNYFIGSNQLVNQKQQKTPLYGVEFFYSLITL